MSGGARTFGELLARHEREIYAYALRLVGSRADADDRRPSEIAGGPADVLGYYKALAGSGRFSQARITSMAIAGGQGVTFAVEVTQ